MLANGNIVFFFRALSMGYNWLSLSIMYLSTYRLSTYLPTCLPTHLLPMYPDMNTFKTQQTSNFFSGEILLSEFRMGTAE